MEHGEGPGLVPTLRYRTSTEKNPTANRISGSVAGDDETTPLDGGTAISWGDRLLSTNGQDNEILVLGWV